MSQQYNDPAGGTPSSIEGAGSSQMNTFFWQRKALIEARKEMFFGPLADTTQMPKHYGKRIKVYHYMPLLDERNVNDQGIDASGVTISDKWGVHFKTTTSSVDFAVEADADDLVADLAGASKSGAGPYTVTFASAVDVLEVSSEALAEYVQEADGNGAVVKRLSGNLYGSSRDVGMITSKLPSVGENGGRVNRVGFTRIQREGSITKFGFFTEFTQEMMDFDSDAELYQHISREMVTGAVQLGEAILQKELLAAAGTVMYAGAATNNAEIDGSDETGIPSLVDYDNLQKLHKVLNDNRTPMQTKVITGSRMIDTKTISAGRVAYIGSDLQKTVEGITDLFGNPAFVPVRMYASAGTILNGEIGTVGHFRIIVVPEMLHWAGAGAAEQTNPGYMATGGRYDVFPMLTVGDGSFTAIGFQTGGRDMKFRIITKMPGKQTADKADPYGETGFSSIKWWHGTLVYRPERLGMIKTLAEE